MKSQSKKNKKHKVNRTQVLGKTFAQFYPVSKMFDQCFRCQQNALIRVQTNPYNIYVFCPECGSLARFRQETVYQSNKKVMLYRYIGAGCVCFCIDNQFYISPIVSYINRAMDLARLIYREKNLDIHLSYFSILKHSIDKFAENNVFYAIGNRNKMKNLKRIFEEMSSEDQIELIQYIERIFQSSYKPIWYNNPVRITKNVSKWKPQIWEATKNDRRHFKVNQRTK